MKRRSFISAATAVCAAPSIAGAQGTFPNRPIMIVVGFAPGGGVDTTIRNVAESLGRRLGQPIVVENRPGATGILATQYVLSGPADGHLLLAGESGMLGLNKALYRKLPYDPSRDLKPISLLTRTPLIVAAHPSFPAGNLRELIDVAKREKLSYANPAQGSLHHLAFERLKREAGFEAEAIPYKGVGPAVADVLGGQIPIIPVDTSAGLPLIQSGKLKALAALSDARVPKLENVATASEQGHPISATPWVGLAAPSGTPSEFVAIISAAVRATMVDPGVVRLFTERSIEPVGSSPAEASAQIDREAKIYYPLIQSLGLQLG